MSSSAPPPPPLPFQSALLAGAIAGITVDLSLYPLDTLKTRLQSRAGFLASGGFRGIYRGIGSAVVGSAPGAALFFCTYEATKAFLSSRSPPSAGITAAESASHHMLAASIGEIAACAVRVPTEVVKQRAQAGQHGGSSARALSAVLALGHGEAGMLGVWMALYRGWVITVLREVPFTMVQFPLWEALKEWGIRRRRRRRRRRYEQEQQQQPTALRPRQDHAGGRHTSDDIVSGLESALYGSISGAVAAALTTPLDVLKTRVMLAQHKVGIGAVLAGIWREEGVRSLFAGIGPRVTWIGIGGAVFLGSYTWVMNLLRAGALRG